jgi:MerR family redox-sensitive transcriptional activator SoxR
MSYSIEEMAKAGCTTPRGVRFWEEQGLLGSVERTEGNQRRFTQEQLDRARIIAAAQFGGWPLAEIGEIVASYSDGARQKVIDRLAAQAEAAARLAEQLPVPSRLQNEFMAFDL